MTLLHPELRPATHRASGWLDEIVTWGVIAVVAVLVGVYVYQMWRQRTAEGESQEHDDQE